jgi:hypothetical protein
MEVKKWSYSPPANLSTDQKIVSYLDFDIMKKRNAIKKGVACRFTCRFDIGKETVLTYVGEDSYVMDFSDILDKKELLTMIRNSYSKFCEKFEFRKLGTELHSSFICPLDESMIDLDGILPMLI